MKRKGFWLVVGAAWLTVATPVRSAEHYKILDREGRFYFGHISYVEPGDPGTGPVILREGREEPAVLNSPVGPGDSLRTSGRRLEVQFDSGTVVRLDLATELRIETILARSLSSVQELSNLSLPAGRAYVMYKEYDRKETFQVLTPSAAVKMRHHSVAMIKASADGSTEVQVSSGRARVLFGEGVKTLAEKEVRKLERLVVLRDGQSQLASFIADTDFELWNRDINARFTELHEGLTAIPKPVQRLSPAVFYFAQNYGNRYGEWLWDDLLGYVWRPFIDNGMYPWGWRPYYYGQWVHAAGGMFWVPREPWGWVPYHLGVWHWDKKKGWVWIPGSLFAPAWVDWEFYFGYASWRPWGLFDWIGDHDASGFYYVDGRWKYDGPAYRPALRTITKAQLKKPSSSSLPLPKELRAAVKNVQAAMANGDPRLLESLQEIPRHLVLVPKGDLGSPEIAGKALSWETLPKLSGVPPATSGPGAFRRYDDPAAEAARIVRGIGTPRALPQRAGPGGPASAEAKLAGPVRATDAGPDAASSRGKEEPGGEGRGPVMRFRDWNPDVKLARQLGVRIEYSSSRNEVLCPELRLSSRDRSEGDSLSRAFHSGPADAGLSTDGSRGSGSSGTASAARTVSSRSTGASEKSSGKGTGEKIKK